MGSSGRRGEAKEHEDDQKNALEPPSGGLSRRTVLFLHVVTSPLTSRRLTHQFSVSRWRDFNETIGSVVRPATRA